MAEVKYVVHDVNEKWYLVAYLEAEKKAPNQILEMLCEMYASEKYRQSQDIADMICVMSYTDTHTLFQLATKRPDIEIRDIASKIMYLSGHHNTLPIPIIDSDLAIVLQKAEKFVRVHSDDQGKRYTSYLILEKDSALSDKEISYLESTNPEIQLIFTKILTNETFLVGDTNLPVYEYQGHFNHSLLPKSQGIYHIMEHALDFEFRSHKSVKEIFLD